MYLQVGHLDIYTESNTCLSGFNTVTFFIGLLEESVVERALG
jgi:hypothetical protein